jgi:tRNA dimethylallyltransferase
MANQKTVIVIAGPTAVGKTGVAIQLARHFNTEIISADSRQCYKEMRIGVARPSVEELAEVRHHFIASHSIYEKVTAALFERYALQKAEELFETNDVIIMVGGTGLYIHAFCAGLDEIPEVPEAIRKEWKEQYKIHGLAWLQNEVACIDPLFYKTGEILNPHRLLRALEVFTATGKSILHFKGGPKKERPFRIIKIGLSLPKEILNGQMNGRVEAMIKGGLEAEARSLTSAKHLPALQTVGYKEMFDLFEGGIDLPRAVEQIKIHTRQYAKRQLTWFKKETDIHWLSPEAGVVIDFVKEKLGAPAN